MALTRAQAETPSLDTFISLGGTVGPDGLVRIGNFVYNPLLYRPDQLRLWQILGTTRAPGTTQADATAAILAAGGDPLDFQYILGLYEAPLNPGSGQVYIQTTNPETGETEREPLAPTVSLQSIITPSTQPTPSGDTLVRTNVPTDVQRTDLSDPLTLIPSTGPGLAAPIMPASSVPGGSVAAAVQALADETAAATGDEPGESSAARPAWLFPVALVAAVLVLTQKRKGR